MKKWQIAIVDRDSRRRSMISTELNVFAGAFGVIMFQCDANEEGRVMDFCGEHFVVSGSASKSIRIWDAATGKVRACFKREDGFFCI